MLSIMIGDDEMIEPFLFEPGCGQVIIHGDYYQVNDDGEISNEKIKVH